MLFLGQLSSLNQICALFFLLLFRGYCNYSWGNWVKGIEHLYCGFHRPIYNFFGGREPRLHILGKLYIFSVHTHAKHFFFLQNLGKARSVFLCNGDIFLGFHGKVWEIFIIHYLGPSQIRKCWCCKCNQWIYNKEDKVHIVH